MDLELKVVGFQCEFPKLYPIIKDSTKVVVMKVTLQSDICLSGKIATLVFGESVEILHNENRKGMSVLLRSGGCLHF